ncbi:MULTISPECIES: hypothetical protein [Nocardia]|nr:MULTISPECIES: hypothetical protein [Nocardia]MBF6349888.1 hypothetical protein [Nocardia flavorosea]
MARVVRVSRRPGIWGIMEASATTRVGVSMDTLVLWALACVVYWFGLL